MALSPEVYGPGVGVALSGLGVLVWRSVAIGVRSVLARIDATETRLCGELAANTALTADTAQQVAHQAAQIAYIQGRMGVRFQDAGGGLDLAVGVAGVPSGPVSPTTGLGGP
jgi:hypothetical protein